MPAARPLLPAAQPRIPRGFLQALRRRRVAPTRFTLMVSVARQRMLLFELDPSQPRQPAYRFRQAFVASTSRHGVGQVMGSNQTPLGLHRIARKIGGRQPVGTVFKSRKPIGLVSQGMPKAPIAHRILWLDGLEPGLNRGGQVDTFSRYVYIHGIGDESTLGRPASIGCVHLAAADLVPLYKKVPRGTLVWIGRR
ncbi:MAG: hypothetical protein RJA22_445 [Verrucomicrobiota bacterium]